MALLALQEIQEFVLKYCITSADKVSFFNEFYSGPFGVTNANYPA